jgi:C1A family cysteine protease
MTDTWGNLDQTAVEALKTSKQRFSDAELAERFSVVDDRVVFRIIRKTDRSLAGRLDIDVEPFGEEPPEGAESLGGGDEEIEPFEDEYEVAEITLISPEDFDYTPELTDADRAAAKPIDASVEALESYFSEDKAFLEDAAATETEAAAAQLPAVIDHRSQQSPVKSQGGRGTCVAHAAMGLIEAYQHIPDNLSEQYAHYKFNEFLGRPHNTDSGLRTTDSAPFLARNDGRVCLEAYWPYIPNQSTINQMVAAGTYGPPQNAINNQRYGINAYKIIGDSGLSGQSIKNTRYLEALLYQGYNIVIGVWVSWDDKDNNGVLDPVLDPQGKPIGQGGHAMVIVGYNRTEQYFIIKNSWRSTWGHSGYGYFSYDFVRSCAKYGYVVDSVVPAAPPEPLPRRLAQAPFHTNKLSRASLRAAIVFFRTSRGRFAVAEAYAGDNLYLRNLRVYNPNGSVHLQKDTLVVRGTYLCDLDTGRETSNDADFWWEAVRPGVNYLVPRNNARVWIAYNLAALTKTTIDRISLTSAAVPSSQLDYAVIVGRTTANRCFKILAHAKSGNRLQLSYLEVFDSLGRRYKYATNVIVPSSWTYNLDTLQLSGGQQADIWWHVISDNVGFLEKYSSARTRLIWSL